MKIKVSELEGAALDWAVARASGENIRHDPMGFKNGSEAGYWVWGDSVGEPKLKVGSASKLGYSPSSNWSQAGPLIAEKITVLIDCETGCYADTWANAGIYGQPFNEYDGQGPTLLVAAMRAIVASDIGGEVDVPDELAAGM